ncbi:MAG: VWA domain-containing protein [Bacillota bacterium]|nr:VWA domain-containing protein [Bacillota bacterium]
MRLLSPASLGFLAFIPLIILMYILKQKFHEQEISSTYLWDQVLKDIEVNTPWQKLKKNLLLLLEILAAALLAFALSQPLLSVAGKNYDDVIIVIDNTGSMNANFSSSQSILDESKKKAVKIINSLGQGSKVSIISCGSQPKVEIAGTTDKAEAVKKIKDINPSNSSGDINDSVSLVKSISKQFKNYRAVFYSDKCIDIKGINGEVDVIPASGDNVSLDYISHSKDDTGITAMVRITNRSKNQLTREVSIYGEQKILNIGSVDLKAGETKTLYFDKIPPSVKYISAEISEKDALLSDNVIYDVIKQSDTQKVLLVSDKNVFIEKAISSISSIELYKTNPGEKLTDKYDLYIFDGNFPKDIPESGNILLINPPENNSILRVNGTVDGGKGEILKSAVTKYMDNAYFTVSKVQSFTVPSWGSTYMNINGKPAGFIGDYKGRKIAVLGFDLHNSDFPLISEFPIFMNNLISYYINDMFSGKTSYLCGDQVTVNPLPDALDVNIKTPSGNKDKLQLKYPVKPFEDTSNEGIYTITQKTKDKTAENLIAINFPSDTESNINHDSKVIENKEASGITKSASFDLQPILIIIIILIMVGEWRQWTIDN